VSLSIAGEAFELNGFEDFNGFNAFNVLTKMSMYLTPHHSYRSPRSARDSAAVRHPGKVGLRQTRAGIQKKFDYIELSLDCGSRPS